MSKWAAEAVHMDNKKMHERETQRLLKERLLQYISTAILEGGYNGLRGAAGLDVCTSLSLWISTR